jgi:hypothetical protein
MPFGVIMEAEGPGLIRSLCEASSLEDADSRSKKVEIRTAPSGSALSVNKSLPDKIQKPFVEIQEDAKRRRNAAGILSVARGCLDVALKDLGESTGGRRVRINNLSEKKIVTAKIAEWAQKLWEEGSDAAHDLVADIDSAIEHVEFLKLFFEVVYALPKRIDAASHADAAKSTDAAAA